MDEQNSTLVICIDDDEVTLDLMASYLRLQGITAIKVQRGSEALTSLETFGESVRLIFLDLAMPEMNGYQVAEAVRSNPAFADIPIVAVTARHSEEARALAAEAGIDELIAKPFAPQQLVDVLVTRGILQ